MIAPRFDGMPSRQPPTKTSHAEDEALTGSANVTLAPLERSLLHGGDLPGAVYAAPRHRHHRYAFNITREACNNVGRAGLDSYTNVAFKLYGISAHRHLRHIEVVPTRFLVPYAVG